jgi:hypothetical protein
LHKKALSWLSKLNNQTWLAHVFSETF